MTLHWINRKDWVVVLGRNLSLFEMEQLPCGCAFYGRQQIITCGCPVQIPLPFDNENDTLDTQLRRLA